MPSGVQSEERIKLWEQWEAATLWWCCVELCAAYCKIVPGMRALRGLDPIIELIFCRTNRERALRERQRKMNGMRSWKSYSSKAKIVLCGVESHTDKQYSITTERPELSCQWETPLWDGTDTTERQKDKRTCAETERIVVRKWKWEGDEQRECKQPYGMPGRCLILTAHLQANTNSVRGVNNWGLLWSFDFKKKGAWGSDGQATS